MKPKLKRLFKNCATGILLLVFLIGIVFIKQRLTPIKPLAVADYPSINVVDLGAVGNANFFNPSDNKYYADKAFKNLSTDSTLAFQKALATKKQVVVPQGNFLISGKLEMEGHSIRIVGSSTGSKIIITSLNYHNRGKDAYNEAAIINKNFAFSYNSQTAQELVLENLFLEYRRNHSNSPKTLILLGNMGKVEIKNVVFNGFSSTEQQITNLDFYVACKNVLVDNCKFINDTNSKAGGCIWVRNLTTKKERISGNNTENVIIRNSSFRKNSNDEIIAVYSVRGDIFNVDIENNTFETFGRSADLIFNIESSEDPFYGVVQNVNFINNKITIHAFNYFVMKLGNEHTNKNVTKNVLIANNIMNIQDTANVRNKWVIYQADKVSKDIRITGNTINNVKDNVRVHGIYCLDTIENNKLNGYFMQAVLRGNVINNIISGANVGLSDPYIASGNIIMNVNTGIEILGGTQHYLYDNLIKTNQNQSHIGTGIAVWDNDNDDPTVYLSGNFINTSHQNDVACRLMKGNIFLKNNSYKGNGENITTSSKTKMNENAVVPSLNDIVSMR